MKRTKQMNSLHRKQKLFAQKLERAFLPFILSAHEKTLRILARSLGGLRRLKKFALMAVVSLFLIVPMTSCSSTPKVSNVTFLELSFEATKPIKPTQCDSPPKDNDYPIPRGVVLKSPIDSIEQGVAYGDAYIRGKDHYAAREGIQAVLWAACDKQHAAALERYNAEIAARERAIQRAKELDD